jgi:hypothetical protein
LGRLFHPFQVSVRMWLPRGRNRNAVQLQMHSY